MTMPWAKRRLGNSGFAVSPVGLGCVGMSGWYGAVDESECERTLERALDIGLDLFDTADAYGLGHNEELLGRVLAPHRGRARIASKFGNLISEAGEPLGADGRPEYVRAACEKSLRRLRTDVIDLYFLHRIDPAVPIEETIGAMADLVKAGKVRAIGLSEASPDSIRRAQAVHPVSAVESEYSLWTRGAEAEVIPLCRELGIAFIAFSPLGRGFFTGRFRADSTLAATDRRRRFPRFDEQSLARNVSLLDPLERIAAELGVSLAPLCIAWILAKCDIAIPIPGSSKVRHLEENASARNIVLSPHDVARFEQAFQSSAVSGERYAADSLKQVGL